MRETNARLAHASGLQACIGSTKLVHLKGSDVHRTLRLRGQAKYRLCAGRSPLAQPSVQAQAREASGSEPTCRLQWRHCPQR